MSFCFLSFKLEIVTISLKESRIKQKEKIKADRFFYWQSEITKFNKKPKEYSSHCAVRSKRRLLMSMENFHEIFEMLFGCKLSTE